MLSPSERQYDGGGEYFIRPCVYVCLFRGLKSITKGKIKCPSPPPERTLSSKNHLFLLTPLRVLHHLDDNGNDGLVLVAHQRADIIRVLDRLQLAPARVLARTGAQAAVLIADDLHVLFGHLLDHVVEVVARLAAAQLGDLPDDALLEGNGRAAAPAQAVLFGHVAHLLHHDEMFIGTEADGVGLGLVGEAGDVLEEVGSVGRGVAAGVQVVGEVAEDLDGHGLHGAVHALGGLVLQAGDACFGFSVMDEKFVKRSLERGVWKEEFRKGV